jgi:hypothetical protein
MKLVTFPTMKTQEQLTALRKNYTDDQRQDIEDKTGEQCWFCGNFCHTTKNDDKFHCYPCRLLFSKNGLRILQTITLDHFEKSGDMWEFHESGKNSDGTPRMEFPIPSPMLGVYEEVEELLTYKTIDGAIETANIYLRSFHPDTHIGAGENTDKHAQRNHAFWFNVLEALKKKKG